MVWHLPPEEVIFRIFHSLTNCINSDVQSRDQKYSMEKLSHCYLSTTRFLLGCFCCQQCGREFDLFSWNNLPIEMLRNRLQNESLESPAVSVVLRNIVFLSFIRTANKHSGNFVCLFPSNKDSLLRKQQSIDNILSTRAEQHS